MLEIPKKWKERQAKKPKKALFNSDLNPIILTLLSNRGIIEKEDIEDFLEPKLSSLRDPEDLPNIDSATKRILKSIEKRERVLVYGDYDADGIISVVLIYDFYRKAGIKIDTYIPDRFEEGYGLNLDFIKKEKIIDGYDLIICVDCGTNATEVKEYLKEKNIELDIIVSDHHRPEYKETPEKNRKEKFIIVNPNLEKSNYPFRGLSGAGVTFKLITSTLRKADDRLKQRFDKSYLTRLLDLTAIATIADLMPLVDENRVIVKYGLDLLGDTKNEGLKLLIEKVLKKNKKIGTYDIAFIIAPRLNASGRIKNADLILRLLSGGKNIEKVIKDIEELNDERRNIQEIIYRDIIKNIDVEEEITSNKVFIAKSKRWHEGVLGIIASKILKKYNVPVLLFCEKEGLVKGSGRSTKNFDLHGNLCKLSDIFEKFGGHSQACGITLKKQNYQKFKYLFSEETRKQIRDKDLIKVIDYDKEIDLNDIDVELLDALDKMKPFGIGNPKPAFLTKGCELKGFKLLKKGKHASVRLGKSGLILEGIIFNIPVSGAEKLKVNKEIDIIYNIEKNDWKKDSIQLKIIDFKIKDG